MTAASLGCEVGVALPARWRRTAEDGLRAVDPSLVYSVRTMWENRRLAARFAEDLVLGGRSASLLHRHR